MCRSKVEHSTEVAAQAEASYRRRQGIRDEVAASEPYAGDTVSDQDRCSRQVQLVEDIRREEIGDGATAALDQDPTKAALPQHAQQVRGLDPASCDRQRNKINMWRQRGARTAFSGYAPEGLGTTIREHPSIARDPRPRIDDHPNRRGSGYGAGGELRIVGDDCLGTDDNGVHQGT